jgi:hypothetical protein
MDRDAFIIMVYCLVCEHYPVIRALYRVPPRFVRRVLTRG